MRRLGLRLVTALAGVASIAAFTVAPAPAYAAPAPVSKAKAQEFTSGLARTSTGAAIDDEATSARVRAYWTAERMRTATPARAPRPARTDGRTAATAGTAGSAATRGAPRTLARPAPAADASTSGASTSGVSTSGVSTNATTPSSAPAVGRVFFTDPYDNDRHFCSAAVVNSHKGKLVQTAAHCVYSHHPVTGQAIGFMSNWTFQPNYQNGPGPAGNWVSENLVVPTAYIQNRSTPGTDIGMAIMAAQGGVPIVSVVGGNGLIVNQPTNVVVTAIGYPASGVYATNGRQLSCVGAARPDTSPQQIVLRDCDFTPGASGGPWMILYDASTGYGYVNSVSSAIYCVNPACDNPRPLDTYGVYFGNLEADLYLYSEAITL